MIRTIQIELQTRGHCDVKDVTPEVMGGFCRHLARWPATERRNGRMKLSDSLATSLVCRLVASSFGTAIKFYLIVSAEKP